ncbi:S-layer homology domain-containing protein [Paenibacillus larvae]|uniref:Thermophilic serine proteinase n=1 Tax=Paenibacillus larvae subsp. larvae TaxID=147375 RepID=A0A2L1U7A2_9BACL|nr:S-layer homology domain-containing protein [Paenibacillus larvae]AVF28801.1 thermophilic serine proteinase [Paenibacillus larvae subsp. larvae]MCY9499063.1 S-layer homology domain-containing protein [Paenibacillus larvae]MCY9745352.1 S-layer homology domain-containing protein [Paenibacillus larvae]MCY9750216.1 S-layer homology domain-containing protein [Paenibacillus larvae]MDR5608817.1 S-layer homology domain-containing protein [Paenibacillus larvae]
MKKVLPIFCLAILVLLSVPGTSFAWYPPDQPAHDQIYITPDNTYQNPARPEGDLHDEVKGYREEGGGYAIIGYYTGRVHDGEKIEIVSYPNGNYILTIHIVDKKPDPVPSPEYPFDDLSGVFNKEQIKYLAEHGLVFGVADREFAPFRPITRAEFTTLIIRSMGLDRQKPTGSKSFNDINPEDWYYNEVLVAAENGIANGIGSELFAPETQITREEAATIVSHSVKKQTTHSIFAGFTDQDEISDWAYAHIQFLLGQKIISGYEDGSFRPLRNLNRAEAAALVYKLVL